LLLRGKKECKAQRRECQITVPTPSKESSASSSAPFSCSSVPDAAAGRLRGWLFRRETGADGKRHQRTLVIGSRKEFRTERDALAQIQTVRTNINRDSLIGPRFFALKFVSD
jgi:hypothetical protein